MRRIWLGMQARLVFDRACTRAKAPVLLELTVKDLGQRLPSQARQLFTDSVSPDAKNASNHLCRHWWRVRMNSRAIFYRYPPTARLGGRGCHTFGCKVPSCSCAMWHICFIQCELV